MDQKMKLSRTPKSRKALAELISRSDYLVVQGNDLAKAFGNLKAFEHRILDYCFSFVTKESEPSQSFVIETTTLLQFLGLTSSGTNYKRIVDAFKTLNQNTALYLPVETNGTRGIRMTQLFAFIDYFESGRITFEFSKYAQPYVFDLKKNFYSFHLRELANIKGKYALILLKLWESHRFGNRPITSIRGTLDNWQDWFLGTNRRMTAGRFLHDVLGRAVNELEEKFPIAISLEQEKKGRKVIGYEMNLIDKKQENQTVEVNHLSDQELEEVIVSEEFLQSADLFVD